MPSKSARADQLQVGDTIRLFDGAFNTCTVKNIKETSPGSGEFEIELFRPYVHFDHVRYTSGIICYTGVEHFSIRADHQEVELLERVVLK